MIRDLTVLGGLAATFVGFGVRGTISTSAVAVGLALAPVILGFGRGSGGCLGHTVRLAMALSLPLLALAGLFDSIEVPMGDLTPLLGSVVILVVVLLGFSVMLGGLKRRSIWQFLGLMPLLIFMMSVGARAGVSPVTIAGFLVAVVVLRLFSQSHVAKTWGGEGVARSSNIAFQIGSSLAGLIAFAVLTSGMGASEEAGSTLGWILAVVALEFGIYFIVYFAAATADD